MSDALAHSPRTAPLLLCSFLACAATLSYTRQPLLASCSRHRADTCRSPSKFSGSSSRSRSPCPTPAHMEPPATSFPVAREAPPRPAPQTAQLGQGPPRQEWWRWAVLAVVLLILTASFAWGVYRARHRPRNLAFIIVTYYLIALLYCCLAKLDLLRRDDPAVAPERWRVRMGLWWVSVALVNVVAARVADAMPDGGYKIAVWVIASVGIGVGFYFFFVRAVAGRRTDDRALHEVSPEQRV